MLALVMLVSSDVGLSMLPSFLARSMRTARVHRPVNNRESVFPSYAAGGAGTIVASAALYRDRLPVEWPGVRYLRAVAKGNSRSVDFLLGC